MELLSLCTSQLLSLCPRAHGQQLLKPTCWSCLRTAAREKQQRPSTAKNKQELREPVGKCCSSAYCYCCEQPAPLSLTQDSYVFHWNPRHWNPLAH